MSTTIESLELEIQSNSQSAVSGIDALTRSLTDLRSATKGGLGLGSISKQLKDVAIASASINSSSTTNVTGLARAIQLFSGTKISSTIATQISAISKSLQGADFSSGKEKMEGLVDALSPLASLSKTNLSSYVSNLKKLPETMTELSKIDMTSMKDKIQEVANAFKPLGDEMQKVANGFSAFPTKIQKLLTATNQIPTANRNASASFTDLYHKVKVAGSAILRIGRSIWSAITKSNDYVENMNLFAVSMGEYAEEAKAYAETVSEAMGIDTSEWIRAQGIFMTMATGFGVASDRAAIMSKNLTQLGYDLASFYNIDIETAMLKLKSGLAGELEPLRAIGYDLSQAKLEATALELGISKSVSAMTQAEKAQLRYYAIMTQVTVAQGDMARTLEDPANQVRVFKAELNMAAREIGNVFIPALNAIIPYGIAVLRIIGDIASVISGLFGGKEKVIEETTGTIVENTDSMSENMEESADSAKKLKSYLLGFDELNIINPNAGSELEDLSDMFDFELPEYDFMNGLIESKVSRIVEKMKEWLGITDEINTWEEFFDTRLGKILKAIGLIGAELLLWKFADGFMTTVSALKAILSSEKYTITLAIGLTIAGLAIAFDGMKSTIEDGLGGFNFAEIIVGDLLTVGATAFIGTKIAGWITTTFAGTKIAGALTTAMGGLIAGGISAVILGIPTYFVGIYDAIMDGLDWLNATLIAGGATLTGAGIGALIGSAAGPVGAAIGAVIGLVVGLITDLVILIVQNWDDIVEFLALVWKDIKSDWGMVADWFNDWVIEPTKNNFKIFCDTISKFFSWAFRDVKSEWGGAPNWFNTNVIQPVIGWFKSLGETITQINEGAWIIVQAVWKVASTWFKDEVIDPKVEQFRIGWDKVSNFASLAWEKIKADWSAFASWFDEWVITPTTNNFKIGCEEIGGFFSNLWEDIKAIWIGVSSWFDKQLIEPTRFLFKTVCSNIGSFFSLMWLDIKKDAVTAMNAVVGAIEWAINGIIRGLNNLIGGFDTVVQWAAEIIGQDWGGINLIGEVKLGRIPVPTFANGGFPEQGQMFIAREAGAEMVGSIGRRTAVANNDQIVSGIAGGVAEANEEQNALLREQNSLLRALLDKDSGVYLDGKNLTDSVEKYQRERGRVLITGGVI